MIVSFQEYLLKSCNSDAEYHCWNSGGKLIIQSWPCGGIYSVGNLNEEGLFVVAFSAFPSLASRYLNTISEIPMSLNTKLSALKR